MLRHKAIDGKGDVGAVRQPWVVGVRDLPAGGRGGQDKRVGGWHGQDGVQHLRLASMVAAAPSTPIAPPTPPRLQVVGLLPSPFAGLNLQMIKPIASALAPSALAARPAPRSLPLLLPRWRLPW